MKGKLMLCLLLLSSCSLFKNTDQTSQKNEQHLEKTRRSLASASRSGENHTQQSIYVKDSSRSDYTIRFWPKGELRLLPGEGLAGEFDSILWKGKTEQGSGSAQNTNTSLLLNDRMSVALQDNLIADADEQKSRKSTTYDEFMIFLIFCGFCLAVFWLYKSKIFK